MELSPYLNSLQNSLKSSAAPAGEDVAEVATLLAASIEPAARLALLEALSGAADEITLALGDTSVEARLRGQDVDFVVTETPDDTPNDLNQTEPVLPDQQDDVARITLRLPESLKVAVEQAAIAANLSVNGWLVDAIASSVSARNVSSGRKHNRSYRGFARS